MLYLQGESVMTAIYNSSGDGISGTLDANYYKGQGLRQGVEREYIVEIQDDISESDRSSDGKQPSGGLLRTGCIQRHVCDGDG